MHCRNSRYPANWTTLLLLLVLVLLWEGTAVTERSILNGRKDLKIRHRVEPTTNHDIVVAVKLRNIDGLREFVERVSDPDLADYGNYMTREELTEFVGNSAGEEAITDYFLRHDAELVHRTLGGELLTFRAEVSVWERLLSTEFYYFDRLNYSGRKVSSIIRSLHYTIPNELREFVNSIFMTSQMPPKQVGSAQISHPIVADDQPHRHLQQGTGQLTPSLLKSYYDIEKVGNVNGSQCVYGTINQYYSPSDLTKFQRTFGLPIEPVSESIGDHNSSAKCIENADNCKEANLDIQYIMAIGQNVPTMYYFDNSSEFVINWLTEVMSMTDPPLVNSISYGADETTIPSSYFIAFETIMMELSAMGVTVLAGSGDDGVGGVPAAISESSCGYNPIWPTTSPYVLSIGATQGPESGMPEVTCSTATDGVITSGGGFSNVYGMPSWQKSAISDYFATVEGTSADPVVGYNKSGRAYPDLSVMGCRYEVYIGGDLHLVSGTSAATPVVAGMIAVINSQRVSMRRKPLGWINKYVYKNYSSFTNDITSGNNSCTTTDICCSEGFTSVEGWDPTTGFGSINFNKFYNLLLNLGYQYTPFPTALPTASPTSKPTAAPTVSPTKSPTTPPTPRPTAPTASPTMAPSRAPTQPTSATISPKKSSNFTVIIVIVLVVIIALIALGCAYTFFCSKDDDEDDTKLIADNQHSTQGIEGISMNPLSSSDSQTALGAVSGFINRFRKNRMLVKQHDDDDEYFGDIMEEEEFRHFTSNTNTNNKSTKKVKSIQDKQRDDVEAANLEMLENVLFSADTNEYEDKQRSNNMFDHISESDISSSVKKLGLEENDLENFLFSADANEYGMPTASLFTTVASKGSSNSKTVMDPEMENIMFSADNNEYSISNEKEDIIRNPIIKLAKSSNASGTGRSSASQTPRSASLSTTTTPRQPKSTSTTPKAQQQQQPLKQSSKDSVGHSSSAGSINVMNQSSEKLISMSTHSEEQSIAEGDIPTVVRMGSSEDIEASFDLYNIYDKPSSPKQQQQHEPEQQLLHATSSYLSTNSLLPHNSSRTLQQPQQPQQPQQQYWESEISTEECFVAVNTEHERLLSRSNITGQNNISSASVSHRASSRSLPSIGNSSSHYMLSSETALTDNGHTNAAVVADVAGEGGDIDFTFEDGFGSPPLASPQASGEQSKSKETSWFDLDYGEYEN